MQKQPIDFDALEKELEAEFTGQQVPTEEPIEDFDEEVSEAQEQEPGLLNPEYIEEDEVEDEEVEEEDEIPVNDPDEHKRNDAFKKLREERDKLAESDKFLSDLAAQYGLSKEELVKRYRDEANKNKPKKKG